jgi:hypothetical protein
MANLERREFIYLILNISLYDTYHYQDFDLYLFVVSEMDVPG